MLMPMLILDLVTINVSFNVDIDIGVGININVNSLLRLIHCEAKKTAPFYFCNSFVRTSSFMTMFGTRIHQ